MPSYTLVGRRYDKDKKVYIDSVFVHKINDERLSSLAKIDKFTSSCSVRDLFKMIKEEHPHVEFSFLSLMYMRTRDSRPYYYNAIIDDSLYNQCISNTREVGRNTYVDVNSKLFIEQRDILLKILESNDFREYEKVCYYGNPTLSSLVKRYIQGDVNSYDETVELKSMILEEFSKYSTFRQWYVCYKNPKRYVSVSSEKVEEGRITKVVGGKKAEKIKIDFREDLLVREDIKDIAVKVNHEHEEEYEEFLNEEEISEMVDYENISKVKRRH